MLVATSSCMKDILYVEEAAIRDELTLALNADLGDVGKDYRLGYCAGMRKALEVIEARIEALEIKLS